jgi:peptidoglycan/xylan/chitin deacetylase (PgdA/CDA1 family)
MLTTVMYHYVREIKNSLYPGIKGLEYEKFKAQLDYLQSNYHIVNAEEVIESCLNGLKIRENSCLLTFDDGYKDHINFVLPELKSRRIQGTFFPPAKAVLDRELLGVNAIHFILQSSSDCGKLLKELFELCMQRGVSSSVLKDWRVRYCFNSKYDTGEVVLFKLMLQHLLDESIRKEVISELFTRYVGQSQDEFADDFYLTVDDIKNMLSEGMYIGSHGYQHAWLNQCSSSEQRQEIGRSIEFLEEVGAATKDWVMCYPYGAYNDDTLKLLAEYKCGIAFVDHGGGTCLDIKNRYCLTRYDTNEIPC